MEPVKLTRILVFLAPAANEHVASVLSHAGYDPSSVSTVPEAFDALRQEDFAFAITTRPDIDMLRNIRPIPVINIEVFFHIIPATGVSQARSRKFDRNAFLERVAFLARTAVTTTDTGPPLCQQKDTADRTISNIRNVIMAAIALFGRHWKVADVQPQIAAIEAFEGQSDARRISLTRSTRRNRQQAGKNPSPPQNV